MLDTAAVAREVVLREPASTLLLYGRDLGVTPELALGWVCALAGLHDLGKASPAFQAKWEPGAKRVQAHGLTWPHPPQDIPHGLITQWALEQLLTDRGWRVPAAHHAADAIGCHHGFRAMSDELEVGRRARGDQSWDEVRNELVAIVLKTLGVIAHPPFVERLSGEAFMRLAGLVSFADWIASSLPFAMLGHDPVTYYVRALDRGRDALEAIGWHPRRPLAAVPGSLEATFRYLGTREQPFRPRPLQSAVQGLLDEIPAPSLLLIEAPMGEGKTEAALYGHLRLQAALGHRGMYVALPTQATGDMMFLRVLDFLEATRGSRHLDLQLLHGAAYLNEQYQAIRARANVPDEDSQAIAADEWFSHKKRALLSEYGVGTVDQALLSVLNIKHQFVRLWGLANRTVVIDEVHAYDTYTSDLIRTLVRWLHALGSSVIVMSATLPIAKRRALLAAFGGSDTSDIPYPRVTRVCQGETRAAPVEARPLSVLELRPTSAELTGLAQLVAQFSAAGGCIACILNTVQRAQDLYRELTPSGLPLYLFHARYPAEERQRREDEVIRLFGKDGTHRPERAVLIATQVVEQSLDLDFDVMVTDLAPVDLVLQRAGRLHRHPRPLEVRHGHDRPVLYIAGLSETADPPSFGPPYYFDRVYDRYVLLRSWAVLKGTRQIVPPTDIDRVVQQVYGGEGLNDNLSPVALRALKEAEAASAATADSDQADAEAVVIGDPDDRTWEIPRSVRRREDDDPGYFVLARTRKGEEGVIAVPLYPAGGGYVLDPQGRQRAPLASELSFQEARAAVMRSVRLSRPEVIRGLKAQLVPRAGWDRHPLLRDRYPLILDGVRNVFGRTLRVSYDLTLGIVYETIRS